MTKEDRFTVIGRRLKYARERHGLTQQQLADALGLDHRQSLAAIEAGERRLSADELLRAMAALGTDVDFFTDAFRLVGEGRFSFRARPGVSAHVLDAFEERAGRWIATYRELGTQAGEAPEWLGHKLELAPRSTFEEAGTAGEAVAERWRLEVSPGQPATEDLFLHVLSTDEAPPAAQLVREGDAVGARIGDIEVRFTGKVGGTLALAGRRIPLREGVERGKYE